MNNLTRGDKNYPLEKDPSKFITRPVIIVDIFLPDFLPDLLVVKITKHTPRKKDDYDTPIVYYSDAGLKQLSTDRISKLIVLNESQIDNKKGELHLLDYKNIFSNLEKFQNSFKP
ncbi:MAG: PemK family transcriptional regulator [Desulfitobacteriaceae bacterium]